VAQIFTLKDKVMTGEEAKAIVLAKYPDAECQKYVYYANSEDYTIFATVNDICQPIGQTAFTEPIAWAYAAIRIKNASD
jgi:hypothetical protein